MIASNPCVRVAAPAIQVLRLYIFPTSTLSPLPDVVNGTCRAAARAIMARRTYANAAWLLVAVLACGVVATRGEYAVYQQSERNSGHLGTSLARAHAWVSTHSLQGPGPLPHLRSRHGNHFICCFGESSAVLLGCWVTAVTDGGSRRCLCVAAVVRAPLVCTLTSRTHAPC